MKRVLLFVAVFALSASLAVAQSQVKKETVTGINNFARIETTVACAGAITATSVPLIKEYGFTSIINLRAATEQGANVEAEEAAAKAAGINYAHIPFVTASPDPTAVDRFLQTITRQGYEPAFIHCAGGGRAAMMWFIKRVMIDRWDNDRAMAEASQLGLTSEPLKNFALNYVQTHKR
jgi:uncharacterized protein (TIGR01244 family)